MNQDENQSGSQAEESGGKTEGSAPVVGENGSQNFLSRHSQQIAGFIGWFAVASVLAPFSYGLLTTPLTIIFLLVCGFSKNSKGVAGGILLAVGINFAAALIRGLSMNAMCFIPFYYFG